MCSNKVNKHLDEAGCMAKASAKKKLSMKKCTGLITSERNKLSAFLLKKRVKVFES